MKKTIAATLLIAFVLGMGLVSQKITSPSTRGPASEKADPSAHFTCKFETGGVGGVGVGHTKHEAFASAAEKCFDLSVGLFERVRGKINMDRGQDFIDSCANLTCI